MPCGLLEISKKIWNDGLTQLLLSLLSVVIIPVTFKVHLHITVKLHRRSRPTIPTTKLKIFFHQFKGSRERTKVAHSTGPWFFVDHLGFLLDLGIVSSISRKTYRVRAQIFRVVRDSSNEKHSQTTCGPRLTSGTISHANVFYPIILGTVPSNPSKLSVISTCYLCTNVPETTTLSEPPYVDLLQFYERLKNPFWVIKATSSRRNCISKNW